jgi:hypothetical protein
MQDPDRPELRPVVRPRRIEPALVVAAMIAVTLGVATWKPWQASGEAARDAPAKNDPEIATSVPGAVARASAAARTPGASGDGAGAASPGSADAPRSAGTRIDVPVTSGINWSGGTRDGHTTWGVAVAYLPFGQLDDALLLRRSAIVPSVRWIAVDPRSASDGSRAAGDVPAGVGGQPAVALAVTWPTGVHVTSERLTYLGRLAAVSAASTGSARPSGSASPVAPSPRPISLAGSVPALLHLTAAGSAGREPVSGTFFLPSSARAHAIVDWLADGWPPGTYEFEVRAGGASYLLAFRLDSGV